MILQNKSHSEILRVRMAYLRPLLGIKNYIQTLNENTAPFLHSASLVIDRLLC